eukprot:c55964_g1_i1 orf=88-267(+)
MHLQQELYILMTEDQILVVFWAPRQIYFSLIEWNKRLEASHVTTKFHTQDAKRKLIKPL